VPESSDNLTVHVALGERSYDIVLVSRQLSGFAAALKGWLTKKNEKRSSLLLNS
jgi:hypothetical protein